MKKGGDSRIVDDRFNEDLDSYIDRRRKGSPRPKKQKVPAGFKDIDFGEAPRNRKSFSFMKNVFRRRIPSEDEIESEVGNLKKQDREDLHNMEEDINDIDEVEEEVQEAQDGLMIRFLKKMRLYRRSSKDDFIDNTDKVPEIDETEELKRTIRILHKWLEELPPEKLNQFKRSPDFEAYKDALRKLKMIKE